MAAWQKPGFIALIVGQDNKTIKEIGEDGKRTVRIPFGTEYKLRFKNTTSARAYVNVSIDGMDALSGKKLVMGPNSELDLERFLQGDNQQGSRFKFVEAANAGVTDPTAGDNGLVRVTFEPEWIAPTVTHTWSYGAAYPGVVTSCAFDPSLASGCINAAQPIGTTFMNVSNASLASCNSVMTSSNTATIPPDLGATAAGSVSQQKFQESYECFATTVPVVLDIWIKGLKAEQPRLAWHVAKNGPGMVVSHGEHVVGLLDSVEITPTHMVLKVPLNVVSFG